MNPVSAQQVALDNALVAPEKRLKIEKCNMRIEFNKPQIEPTFQVTLDVFKHSPCYLTFLITTEVLEIYMHQLWNTIMKIKVTDEYQLPNQDFVEPPSDEEMFHLSRISSTLECGICHLRSIQVKCTSPGKYLLLSSIEEEPAKKPKWAKHPEPAKKSASAKKMYLQRILQENSQVMYKSETLMGESGDDDDSDDDDDNDDDNDDDGGNNDASNDERTEYDKDENPNLNQIDDNIEEEYEDEYARTPSSYESTNVEN
nr:hypothetical protein [Tanacetum cinerariifolium]